RDPERILALLRERLATVQLPGRVEGMVLAAEETAGLATRSLSFFPDAEGAGESRAALVERLRARLGEEAVQGLVPFPDARPELAWACAQPGTRGAAATSHPRPAWLLAVPRALAARGGRPWLDGPIELLAGPERIESGWWDGRDVARDYFLARDGHGARLWVFRERRERGGWYLHGVFS
ncbi:MAG TPA: DNA polymerase Y family protein, partial [Burkholderiales bacterium]|nr:DNA polymerase Y family protein [Burkholderiales bacterium]